jgi:uncharacterized membrane protein YhaH (DUF805 family)
MEWYLMVWRKYAEFDGRSRRKEYWMFLLFQVPILLLLMGLGFAGNGIWENNAWVDNNGWVLFIPYAIYALASLVPSWAVGIRRLHDTGRSGWWILLSLAAVIPFVGIIPAAIFLIFTCLDGNPGPNEYGPNPKFPEQAVGVFAGSGTFTSMGLSAQPQPLAGANGIGNCKSCGAMLKDAAPFCSSCGAHI